MTLLPPSQDEPIDIGPCKYDFPVGFMQVGDRFLVTEGAETLYRIISKIHDSTDRHYILTTNRERTAKICTRIE